jgi:hypothetical protein
MNRMAQLTIGTGLHAVNTEAGVLLLHLTGLNRSQGLNRAETRVLGKSERDGIESIGESAHGILLNAGALDGGIFNCKRASNLGSTTTVDNTIVADQVADDAKSIV